MLPSASVAIITALLSFSASGAEKPPIPTSILAKAFDKAKCAVGPAETKVLGTERLARHLRVVQMLCSPESGNAKSILFSVPPSRPSKGRLAMVQQWSNGRILPGYTVSAPGYDFHTKTMSSLFNKRRSGDCGAIGEWRWTGWFFRLLHYWVKDVCDGVPFDWDARHRWQVYPVRK